MMSTKMPFVPLAEAADILKLTHGRLRQMLRAGELDGLKVNQRAWLVSRKDVSKLAARRQK